MITRQRIGVGIIFSAIIAGFPNYLWLLGILPKPSDDLMAARWIYEALTMVLGGMIGWGP
jgi:hypothetical protein